MIEAELTLIKKWMSGVEGPILDVGSSTADFRAREKCPYDLAQLTGLEVVSFDAKHAPGVDIVGDAEQMSLFLNGRTFPAIVCTSLFEHVRRPWIVAAECYQALRPGGRLFASAPWVYEWHSDPLDCYRFSIEGLRSICLDPGFRELSEGEIRFGTAIISFFVGEKR